MKWSRIFALVLGCLVAVGALAATPPEPGSVAPEFALPDAAGKEWHVADWRGRWLVLYFYPKDDTPGCTTEAQNFRDNLAQFQQLNAVVVGVSLDDGASHQAFAERHKLPFPLLVDADGVVARRYGALSNFGVVKFAKRYTFLVDPDGRVVKVYQEVDAARHALEIVADIRALAGK